MSLSGDRAVFFVRIFVMLFGIFTLKIVPFIQYMPLMFVSLLPGLSEVLHSDIWIFPCPGFPLFLNSLQQK
jgi:hypothetical protein